MKNIIITTPTISDIDTLWKWGEENWELWGDEKYKGYSQKTWKLWVQNPKNDILLIAKDGKKLIGMCIIQVMRHEAFCSELFVEKEYRNQGIGRLLLDHATEKIKQKGIKFIWLLVNTKNKQGLSFYKQLGFHQGFDFSLLIKKIT